MDITSLNVKEIATYINSTGKRGGLVLSVLGRLDKYIESVVKSDVGREILNDDISRTEELVIKIYKEEASSLELAEFRYLRDIRLPNVIGKIKKYLELTKEVKTHVISTYNNPSGVDKG